MKTGMGHRLLKEARALLPAWVLTVVLMLLYHICVKTKNDHIWFAWNVYALEAQFISAVVFGHEFSDKTIGLLLTHPVSRSRIYLEKLTVLALALTLLVLGMALATWWSIPYLRAPVEDSFGMVVLALLLPVVIGWCSGPLMSLIMRSTLGGMTLTILLPWIFVMLPWAFDYYPEATYRWMFGYTLASQGSFALVCAILGYLTFCKFQDKGSGSTDIAASVLGTLTDRIAAGSGAIPNLIKKEFRLQQPVFILMAVILAFWVILFGLKCARPMLPVEYLIVPVAILIVAIPGLAGIITVAEERHLGLHDWHLTLPQSPCRQWVIKIGTGYMVNVALGLFTGLVLVLMTQSFFHTTIVGKTDGLGWFALNLWIFSAAAYASSFSANSLRALLGTGVIACMMAAVWFMPSFIPVGFRQPSLPDLIFFASSNFCFFWILGFYNFRRTLGPLSGLLRQTIWIALIGLLLIRLTLDI